MLGRVFSNEAVGEEPWISTDDTLREAIEELGKEDLLDQLPEGELKDILRQGVEDL